MTPSDFATLESSHKELKAEVAQIKLDLKGNTEATGRIETNTREIVEAFTAAKGAFAVLEWGGKVAAKLVWLAIPGAILLGGWQQLKTWFTTRPPP